MARHVPGEGPHRERHEWYARAHLDRAGDAETLCQVHRAGLDGPPRRPDLVGAGGRYSRYRTMGCPVILEAEIALARERVRPAAMDSW